MRAITSDFDNSAPTDSLLGVLDQFAALRAYSADAPTVGGYRLLTQKHAKPFKMARDATMTAATVAALARARLRLTGFLSVMFVGALGLAVLAGPATCPSCGNGASEHSSLARLGYAENARFATARNEIKDEIELPILATSTLLEPEASASGVSPITTSALDPSREFAAAKPDQPATIRAGRLPAAAVKALTDAGPTIRLAAASINADMLATLPAIEVTTPPKAEVTATDVEAVAEDKPVAPKKRILRAYRTPVAKAVVKRASRSGDGMIVKRAPRWAQQMYVTPWQSQAFSYTR